MTDDRSPAAPLALSLFGPLQVWVRGEPLRPLRSRKGGWLLALLTLRAGCPVERRWLMDRLWPDSPPRPAAHSLRTALSDLRRALGPEAARLRSPAPGTLNLDLSDAVVDLRTFDDGIARGCRESLEAAAALYRGPLLEGCDQPWACQERRRREQALLSALESLAARALEAGDLASAERHLRRAVEIDPVRERAHRSLMRVLASGGNTAAALLVYRALAWRLAHATDTSPSPETQALFAELQPELLPEAGGAPSPDEQRASALPLAIPSLPNPLTRFIGREREMAAVVQSLSEAHIPGAPRLVTLTGTGGCGKSRLALEIARQLAESMPGGVCFVELASLTDPALVPQIVAAALGIREEPGLPLLAALTGTLRSRELLLLLDNCEHLIDACARLVEALLKECPALRILATSRRPLKAPQEWLLPVPPLSLPTEVDGPATPDSSRLPTACCRRLTLTTSEAVQLFLDRAIVVLPPFRLTDENAASVAAICRQLDGIPLAIELAAARMRLLPVDEIAARLEDRFRLLTHGSRSAPRRHQTLEAAIEWSYHLLSPKEQALLRRLSVFAGGFTTTAAEQVCSDFEPQMDTNGYKSELKVGEGSPADSSNPCSSLSICGSMLRTAEVLDLLAELVEQSLVVVEAHDGRVRHRLLESVREYGRQRLAPEERAAVAERHAAYFLALAEAADPKQGARGAIACLERLEIEHDNLRAALRWSLGPEGRLDVGMRLAAALEWFWASRSRQREGREWLETLHERSKARVGAVAPAVRARALGALANLQNATEPLKARETFKAMQMMAEGLGERVLVAWATLGIGTTWLGLNNWERARQCQEESLAIFREHGERLGLAWALAFLGTTEYRAMGGAAKARALLEESLGVAEEIGDLTAPSLALPILGELAHTEGDFGTARAYHERALDLYQAQGIQLGVAGSLDRLALLAHAEGDDEAAARLAQQALTIFRQMEKEWQVTSTLSLLGNIEYRQGKLAQAKARHEEVLETWRRVGFQGGMVWSLSLLGEIASREGRSARAHSYVQEAWTIWRDWEEQWRADMRRHLTHSWHLGSLLFSLGRGAAVGGDTEAARALIEESKAHREAAADPQGVWECREALAALGPAVQRGEPSAEELDGTFGVAALPAISSSMGGGDGAQRVARVPIPAAARLSLTLFGPFEARLGREFLRPLRSWKSYRLLALLALRHRSPVERSWLAGTLWPECPEPQALANLRNALADLRRALGPEGERLTAPSRHTLALDLADAAVDVVTFDQAMKRRDPSSLAHAVGLYRGPLLEGWVDEWAFQERLAREQAYLETLEALAARCQQGDWRQAERYLRQAIATDPTRESAHRALMTVRTAGGDPGAAVRTYGELCRLLQDLDSTPAIQTTRLFDEIRAGIP